MNDFNKAQLMFWRAPAPSAPGNPPKMSIPHDGKLEKPVNWTQTRYIKGSQSPERGYTDER